MTSKQALGCVCMCSLLGCGSAPIKGHSGRVEVATTKFEQGKCSFLFGFKGALLKCEVK